MKRGISLTEVLIAMGIMTVGLLGVAAVFPVGSWYMQKAEVSDRASAIAQSVMNDIVTEGMLNPAAWFVTVPNTRDTVLNRWNSGFSADGKYMPAPRTMRPMTFTRPFAEALSDALTQSSLYDSKSDRSLLGKQFGSAYVIDPIGVAAMAFPRVPTTADRNGPAMTFPASAYAAAGGGELYFTSPYWLSWSAVSGNADRGQLWPIRRVTFRQPSTGWHMDRTTADHYFRSSDDLAYDFPDRDDRPAIQKLDTANGVALARQWTGDYSWIVTVVPTTSAARDGMATNPEGFSYNVSVVVFYKRPLPSDPQLIMTTTATKDDYYRGVSDGERVVGASVLSTGLNGGELLLSDQNSRGALEGLKVGQWIMLCGPHPNSKTPDTDNAPADQRFVLNWYQVLTNDAATPAVNGYNASWQQRVVAVRGAEWPWLPQANYDPSQQSSDVAKLSNYLCVGICKGAVAVHTKTLRLEGPRGAASVALGKGGDPTTDSPGHWP